MRRIALLLVAFSWCAASAASAFGHFVWVVRDPSDARRVKVYFAEQAEPDDPALLDRIVGARCWAVGARRGATEPVELKKGTDALDGTLPEGSGNATVALHRTYGVVSRGGSTFLLEYHAKSHAAPLPGTWNAVGDAQGLPLEVVARPQGEKLALLVTWQGQPLAGAEVTVEGPGLEKAVKGTTGEDGTFAFQPEKAGTFSIRAKHVEAKKGTYEEQEYAEVRHYSTLALPFAPAVLKSATHAWPDLPKGITSFGGAVLGDALYVYGGHFGEAHHYSREGQSNELRKLDLKNPKEWTLVSTGPARTGTALIGWKDKLVRIGGFEAVNANGVAQDLKSRADVSAFDPQAGRWDALPDLPEPRSSHDAALIGGTVYVAGGWQLGAEGGEKWHTTAWELDLSSAASAWKALPEPPFRRRALSLAAHAGRLYCVGGMRESGGPTTEVAVYDPAARTWSTGPNLLGGPLDGFGSSAFAVGGRLYVTTMSGSIQRLAADGQSWEFVGQMQHPRFFHRLLPWHDRDLVLVGGASMATGKITAAERWTTPERP